MPISLDIDKTRRRLTAICRDVVCLADVEAMFDTVVTEGALAFAKLVDMNDAKASLTDADMLMIGGRVRAYSNFMAAHSMGPLAIVARSDKDRQQAELFCGLGQARRPAQVFGDVASAAAWLETQTGNSATPAVSHPRAISRSA
jgi:hypothetical protein